jgi:flotillin
VLNGADGLGEIAAGLVGQGLTIYDTVRDSLATVAPEEAEVSANGASAATPDGTAAVAAGAGGGGVPGT